jgi:hypothetical protein
MSEALRRIDTNVYGDRRPIIAEVIALLHVSFDERGLKLIESKSRAVKKGEIHELMITDEQEAAPGKTVDHVRVLCFFEVKQGGLAVIGDQVEIGGMPAGALAGWDFTHIPNHMNFLVKRENISHPPLRVGAQVEIHSN